MVQLLTMLRMFRIMFTLKSSQGKITLTDCKIILRPFFVEGLQF